MIVKGEYPNYEVHLNGEAGDVCTWYERKKNPKDIPLSICYNLGADFPDCPPHVQQVRVRDMRKMLKESVNGVIGNMQKLLPAGITSCGSVEGSFRTRKGRGWAPPSWGRHI